MAAERQNRTAPKRLAIEWPDLPDEINDKEALKKWYFDLRTCLEQIKTEIEDMQNDNVTS